MEATDIIREMYAAAMSENIDAIKEQVESNQREHLRQIVPSGWKAFWLGVLQSIAGALVFAILLAAFAFVVRYKGTDFDNITHSQNDNNPTIVIPE